MAFEDKFHSAASNGQLDVLKEGTKRELNQVDEDGITPTHCAAASSHLDALRVIIGRGGNPDKSDYLGRTALHHASMKGHMDCVTYLVNWGCNIWALDNGHHDAFDVSSTNNRQDIMKYLDQQRNVQLQKNRKTVDKQKEKAITEYDKNLKRYEKLQQEAKKIAQKENKKFHDMQQTEGPSNPMGKTTIRQKLKTLTIGIKGGKRSQPFPNNTTAARSNNRTYNSNKTFHVGEMDESGKMTLHSPTGITRGPNVMYVDGKPETSNNYDYDEPNSIVPSIFNRPGMGNIAFLKHQQVAASSLFAAEQPLNEDKEQGHITDHRTTVFSNSIAADIRHVPTDLPWDDELIGNLDDDDNDKLPTKYSSLELFLVTFNLEDYFDVFTREKIDLESLMLLEDEDLKSLNVELGPRRKLKNALERRRDVIRSPGAMLDTRF